MKFAEAIAVIIGAIGMVLLISFVFSLPVYLLWNYCLVGAVSGVNEVTWLQAWGISVLCSLLFKQSTSKTKS